MAKLPLSGGNIRTYKIKKWLGVNQNPDGDTELRLGEAASMRNFRVTRESSLQIRPGYHAKCTLSTGNPVRGMWTGYVNGAFYLLAACGGHVWSIDTSAWTAADLGAVTDAQTFFFGFGDKVYILDGTDYYSWDGTTFGSVAGYAPVIATAAPPAGGGTLLESVNKLTGQKRQQFSPDGSATVFQLAETEVDSIDRVEVDGEEVTTGFAAGTSAGTVTFTSAPASGTNTVEITWTKGTGDRSTITAQLFAEPFNGYTDNRIFLYGDGTNKAYYSGLDEDGLATAEYFPDLNVLDVGTENTPVTSLIRHFNKLMAFKSDSTYLIYYDTLTLEDGTTAAGFYTRPIDKITGNAAPGQVRLANNFPISLHGNSEYRWGLVYSSGVQDERAARRISDPVLETLGGMSLSAAVTFDDEWNREFWIVQNGTACVYQYAGEAQGDTSYKNNLWYIYTGIPAVCFVSVDGELYFGTGGGSVMHLSRDYHSDAGEEIDAYWE